jgi:hypothetical protein
MKVNGSIEFDASSSSEIKNLRVQKYANLTARPAWTSADAGRLVYVVDPGTIYVGGVSSWIAVATGGDASALQAEVDAIEASLGSMVNANGVFDGSVFVGLNSTIWPTNPTSLTDALDKLSDYVSGADTLAELKDVTFTSLVNGDLIRYNGSSWVNVPSSDFQAHSENLDALSSPYTAGFLIRDGENEGSFGTATLAPPAAGLTITGGDFSTLTQGDAVEVTFGLANDLAALEGLAATGFAVRTGADQWTQRSVTGSAGRVVVSNGDGVSASPTIDLDTVVATSGGTFQKFTTDSYGRVTAVSDVVAGDITAFTDSLYVAKAGDTMSGALNMGGNLISGLGAGVAGTDAVNKNQLDAAVTGLSWKQAARVATTGNVALATALAAGQVVDGVTLVAGDRVLVRAQTAAAENGVYVVPASGAASRAADMDVAAEFGGATVFVQEGTANADSGWTQTAEVTTVGTSAVTFVQFTGSGTYTAGIGLSLNGNTFDVNLGAGIAALPSDEVGIELYDSAAGAIVLTTTGSDRSTDTASKLHLLLKSAGGLTQDVDGLYIPAAGVSNAMLANSTVTLDADGAGTATVALGGTLAVFGTSAQGISTSITGGNIIVTAADASDTQKGVASFDNGHFTVTAGVVTLNATLDDLANVAGVDGAAAGAVLTKGAGSDWESVSRANLVGSTSVGDHNDVTLTSPSAGDILVRDGAGQFVNKKAYFLYDGASSGTHVVTHNLGQKYCNVTVVDASDEVVIPQSITFNDENKLTVTFNTAIAAKVIVMGIA